MPILSICVDCDKDISKTATRCRSCARRHEWKNGRVIGNPRALRRPSTVRNLSEVEAAWLGALIEGEGHIAAHWSGGYVSPRVVVEMTEIEPISTLLRLAGDGTIVRYDPKETGYKERWRWELKKRASLQVFLPQILPFLASKRDVAQQVLEVVS